LNGGIKVDNTRRLMFLIISIIITAQLAHSVELQGCQLTFSADFDDGTIDAQVAPETLKAGSVSDGLSPSFCKGIRGKAIKTGGNTDVEVNPRPRWWTANTAGTVNSIEMPFTLSFWFKFENALFNVPNANIFILVQMYDSGYQVFQTTEDALDFYYLCLDYNGPQMRFWYTMGTDPLRPRFKTDEWYHLTVSWDTVVQDDIEVSRINYYRDGIYLGSGIFNRLITQEDISKHRLMQFGIPNNITGNAVMLGDELKCWKGTALPDDVLALYRNRYPFPNKPENTGVLRDETINWRTKITWIAPEGSPKGEEARFFRVYRSNSPDFEKYENTLVEEFAFFGSPGEEVTWIDVFTSDYNNRCEDFYYAISAISYEGGNDYHSLSEEIYAPGAAKAEISGQVKSGE
jgi:hypothetical protein